MRRATGTLTGRLNALVLAAGLFLGTVLAGAVAAPPACACSCVPQGSTEDAVRGFDAVFRGVPTRKAVSADRVVYEVAVSAVYSGTVGAVVTVSTPRDTCGVSFPTGEEVLIFASRGNGGPASALFSTALCSQPPAAEDEIAAAVTQVYGDSHLPDADAPSATLPRDDKTVTRVIAYVVPIVLLCIVSTIGIIVWMKVWRKRRRG